MMRYRAGVIGHTGRGDYGHGLDTVFLSLPQVEIVAVADANPLGRTRTGERLGIPPERRYADYREMLARESLDLVSVAPRWCDQHRDMVVAAAESGAKAIYCEKPLARTLREADEMLNACAKRGVKLAVAHQRRGDPLIATAKRLVAEGFIGTLVELRGFGKQDARGGGQDLMVLGTHILDLMIYFAGKPEWVQAAIWQNEREATLEDVREGDECIGLILGDRIHALYGFPHGVVGHFESRKGGNRFGDRSMGLHILGTEGILAYRGGYLLHYPHPCWTPAPNEPETWRVVESTVGGVNVAHDLVRSLEENREPLANGEDARWALEMILGVYAAYRFGRRRLPLANREHPLRQETL